MTVAKIEQDVAKEVLVSAMIGWLWKMDGDLAKILGAKLCRENREEVPRTMSVSLINTFGIKNTVCPLR